MSVYIENDESIDISFQKENTFETAVFINGKVFMVVSSDFYESEITKAFIDLKRKFEV